jgi:hypothetical protein
MLVSIEASMTLSIRFYAIYMANRFPHIATLWNAAAQSPHEDPDQILCSRTPGKEPLPDRRRFALAALCG